METPTLQSLAASALRVGCLGFGGPAGQIALLHRVYVEERAWIDEARFLHALNYCMLLPGPEAQQLATYVGWRLRGVLGGVISGLLFVLPGALVMLALSWLYVSQSGSAPLAAAFLGVQAAVLALVAEALLRVGRRALKTRLDHAIALASFVALHAFGAPFPVVVLGAAAFGAALGRGAIAAEPSPLGEAPSLRGLLSNAAVWSAIWLAPIAAVFIWRGPDDVLSQIGLLFSQLATVSFGGAYAVLGLLREAAVETQGWLTPAQMMDGLGLAETTPGPLVLVNQHVGFLAGWSAEGGGLGLALAAAATASWATFAPSFLWVFAGAPFAERLRAFAPAAAALKGVTAAAFGVIASLALWFAQHALFERQTEIALPWGAIEAPVPASFDLATSVIAALAALALFRFKAGALAVTLGAAGLGLAQGWLT